MHITWPSNTREIINEIRGAIGRDVIFVAIETQDYCPVCGIDPITNTTIDPFCPTCSGVGYIYTYSTTTISGHVTWGYSEQLGWRAGGQLDEGECRVQIEYTQANLDAVNSTQWVEVDGKQMQIMKKTLRGVQPLNRILIDLIEKEE